MKDKTLKRLIDEYIEMNGNDGLSEHVCEVLSQEKSLKYERNRLRKELQDKEDSMAEWRKEYDRYMRELYDACPHWEFSFFGDPSGGNDSFNKCDLCGYEW